jgi:hypothetical protein
MNSTSTRLPQHYPAIFIGINTRIIFTKALVLILDGDQVLHHKVHSVARFNII